MPIVTATEVYGIASPDALRTWLVARAVAALTTEGVRGELVPGPGDVDASAGAAVAYVNEGRWCADCPTEGCGGSQVLLNGAAYWCPYCLNLDLALRWRAVQWPERRGDIEAALMARRRAANRNWWPWESVDALAAETAAHEAVS